ncbi:MAG: hypothetical protein RI572_12035 [Salegentibacter sp.]|uniref:Uncharacterized protein n=1 Tax=Salegentibacter flavus TaxID=287099 RepID=A0A1I5D7Z9_9FLAO|nr:MULTISPECIES: hypothetical protein [Salegentibacter]MDR9458128.1 hypothetical protein [Salegentibacter sp.]SFN95320.1 hypothetical protein SAMN05660413_03211 [Salegentibacter flavus]
MKTTQLINTVLIVLGGALLLYAIAAEDANQYVKITGLVIIMFGLFRATNFWVATKDDHKEDKEEDKQ